MDEAKLDGTDMKTIVVVTVVIELLNLLPFLLGIPNSSLNSKIHSVTVQQLADANQFKVVREQHSLLHTSFDSCCIISLL